jgi:hypothetical protein
VAATVGDGLGDGDGVARSAAGTRSFDVVFDGAGFAVALAVGVADGPIVVVTAGAGLAEADAVGVGEPGPAWSTCRNRSSAVWSSAASWDRLAPGAETTMSLLPWVLMLAPPTPAASTRWRMMLTAWDSAPEVTFFPCSGVASRMTWVPPRRSSPSFGVDDGPRNSPR